MNEILRTQSLKVPGMPCPACNTPIVINPILLLSAQPIICAACNLELHVDTEASKQTLSALSNYIDSFQQVQSDFHHKVGDMTSNKEPKNSKKRTLKRSTEHNLKKG